ncbi:MAG: hypothetical protein AB1679_33595 [Actinomycetota bacterium]
MAASASRGASDWGVGLLERATGWLRPSEGFGAAVTNADVFAAYGHPVSGSSITSNVRRTEVRFRLATPQQACVKVVIARPKLTDESVDDPEWFPREKVLRELDGVGDAAYVTKTGGIVARLGARWVAGVEPCSRRAAWSPPLEETIDLMRRVLDRLATTEEPLPFVPVLDPSDRMERWRERYRVARRRDVLAGLTADQIDAREDARFARDRLFISLLAGVAVSIGAVSRAGASSRAAWFLAVTVLSVLLVGGIWLVMGLQAPARERRRRQEERRSRQRRRRGQGQVTGSASASSQERARQSTDLSLRERLVLTALLLLASAGSAGVSWALFQESGGAAIVGEIGEATVGGDCSGFRTRRCEISLRDSRGEPIPGQAWLHTFGLEADPGDVVRVRYRSEDAVPDTLLSRAGATIIFGLFLLLAAWTLWGVPVLLFQLRGSVSDFLGRAFACTAAATVVVGVLVWFVT